MKKVITIILIGAFYISFGQDKKETSSGFFAFKYKMPAFERLMLYDPVAKKAEEKNTVSKLRFRISKITGDTTFIRFKYSLKDNDELKKDPNYDTYVNEKNSRKEFFFVKAPGEIYNYRYSGLAWGVIIAPIKIRPETKFEGQDIPLKLTTNITVGPYIGFQWGRKEFSAQEEASISHTIVAFASPYTSFTEINTSNSNDTSKNGTTVAALSFGGGYLFEISKKFQLGALVGWDYVGGDLAKKWYYQGKAWYSVAIGFNFTK